MKTPIKILGFSDPHIEEDAIAELTDIFNEIFNTRADILVCAGDFYDKKNPSAYEINFGTKILAEARKIYKEVHIVRGNHDGDSLNYLEHMGINIHQNGYIRDNIYFAHFFTDESAKAFNSYSVPVQTLKEHDLTILGHQHSFQKLSNNAYHIGSPRFCDFGEVLDKKKVICTIDNDNNIKFKTLKTPIPMYDISDTTMLSSLDNRSKVRFVVKSFDQLKKDLDIIEKYKEKFYQFKVKLDFVEQDTVQISTKEVQTLKSLIEQWIDNISDTSVKAELEDSFKKAEMI